MNKPLVALGIAVLIIGMVTTLETGTFHREVVKRTYPTEKGQSVGDPWSISANFTAGNRLNFTLTPGRDWGDMAEGNNPWDEFPFPPAFVDVSIVDPRGKMTNFTIVFAQTGTGTSVNPGLRLFGANVTSNEGGLTMDDRDIIAQGNHSVYYTGIKGIVNYDGVYTAIVHEGPPAPPAFLYLYRQQLASEMPYLFIAPIGGVVIGSGIALSIWASKKTGHRAKLRNSRS